MAKTPISDEELQLRKRARRRLVGAIVLVLLVVVLVPMFLEREPRLQKQDMDIRIPPIPGQTQAPSIPGAAPSAPAQPPPPVEKLETASPPATSPSLEPATRPAAPSATADTPPSESPAAKAPAPPPAQRAAPAPQTKSEPAAKPPALTPSKELAAGDGYVVQLGAFSSSANAKQLLHKLKVEKFPAYTEAVKTTQGEKTRVRVGPYPSADVAEKARDRLKSLKLVFGNDARVMRAGE